MKDEKILRKRRRYAFYILVFIAIVFYLPSQIVMNQIQGTNYSPTTLKWSSNNNIIATSIVNNGQIYVKLWNSTNGQLIKTLSLPSPCSESNQSGCLDYYASAGNYLYWSPTNDRLAIYIPEQLNSQINNSLAIWNVHSAQLLTTFSWYGTGSADIFWTATSAELAVIRSNIIEVWNLTSTMLIHTVVPTTNTRLNGILWYPDGQSVITGNATSIGNWSLITWNISNGQIINTFYGDTSSATLKPLTMNANGTEVLISYSLSSTKDQIEIIDVQNNKVFKSFSIDNLLGLDPSWSPEQSKLLIYSDPLVILDLNSVNETNYSNLLVGGIATWNTGGTQLAVVYSTSLTTINILDSSTLSLSTSINLNTDAQTFNIAGAIGMISIWAVFLLFLAIVSLTEQLPRKKKWLEKEKLGGEV